MEYGWEESCHDVRQQKDGALGRTFIPGERKFQETLWRKWCSQLQKQHSCSSRPLTQHQAPFSACVPLVNLLELELVLPILSLFIYADVDSKKTNMVDSN